VFSIAQRTTPAPFLGEDDDDNDIGDIKQGKCTTPAPFPGDDATGLKATWQLSEEK
jgi:hypothetical protein